MKTKKEYLLERADNYHFTLPEIDEEVGCTLPRLTLECVTSEEYLYYTNLQGFIEDCKKIQVHIKEISFDVGIPSECKLSSDDGYHETITMTCLLKSPITEVGNPDA